MTRGATRTTKAMLAPGRCWAAWRRWGLAAVLDLALLSAPAGAAAPVRIPAEATLHANARVHAGPAMPEPATSGQRPGPIDPALLAPPGGLLCSHGKQEVSAGSCERVVQVSPAGADSRGCGCHPPERDVIVGPEAEGGRQARHCGVDHATQRRVAVLLWPAHGSPKPSRARAGSRPAVSSFTTEFGGRGTPRSQPSKTAAASSRAGFSMASSGPWSMRCT